MKKIISALILTCIFSISFAQNNKIELNCYDKYAKVFEKRGANEVLDGTYDNVIISIRKGSMADCFYGKVTVTDRSVDLKNVFLKFEDDTFEKLELEFKYKEKEKMVAIVNGISNVILTEDEELVNILFVKNIKPKKKKYAKAAEPNFDL